MRSKAMYGRVSLTIDIRSGCVGDGIGTVVFERTAGQNVRMSHLLRIKRLDWMQRDTANNGQTSATF